MNTLSKQQAAANKPQEPVPGKTASEQSPKAQGSVENRVEVPAKSAKYEEATFAAGCFWGVEAAFRAVEGVVATEVGYTGGSLENPTYKQVCTDRTGHAEAVRVTYDPNTVSYQDLLDVFWKIHDPTTMNRQGPDLGTQYRSAIFYHTPRQQALARASMQRLQETRKSRFNRSSQPIDCYLFFPAIRSTQYAIRFMPCVFSAKPDRPTQPAKLSPAQESPQTCHKTCW